MKQTIITITTSLFFTCFSLAQGFLETPIEGSQGEDWIIVDYVDWGTAMDIQDHNCGTKTYSGHEGTNFTIRSFKQMDAGVNVLAAASGRVTFINDGVFDRETDGDVSKGFGNFIAIRHPNKYHSYYAHLKKNSLLVSAGDSVEAGQVIAQIGSSGNSTDPHVHFETWYDSLILVDPFGGQCGNDSSLFINQVAYDTSLTVWEYGLHHKNDLTINDLRNRIETIECCPYEFEPTGDSSINIWAHMYGLREGKELKAVWLSPTGLEWFSFSNTLDRDYWYYYYWTFINQVDLPVGDWTVQLYYDDGLLFEQDFVVKLSTSTVEPALKEGICSKYSTLSISDVASLRSNESLRIFNVQGQLVQPSALETLLPSGIYILNIITEGGAECNIKKWKD